MAALIGGLKGNRGQVTRLGSKTSGITAWLKSWKTKVEITLWSNDSVLITTHSLQSTEPKIYINGRCVYNPNRR